MLPAATFADGPPSGSLLGTAAINGFLPPFSSQPVQGISGILRDGRGGYLAMSDNGFGATENSADFLLRVYRIRPSFEHASGGAGGVEVRGFIQLRDPNHRIGFPLTRPDRRLTGADFDIESVRRDDDGDLWFGDGFGPSLLHTDETGVVLDAPFPLAGAKSPQNPTLGSEAPTLGRSKGFEGMAVSSNGRYLYPMLEGALLADADQRRRFIHEFDTTRDRYTGRRFAYRMAEAANATGDLTRLAGDRLIVIERDERQDALAAYKRLVAIDLSESGVDGFLGRRDVADLLAISDPTAISLPARPGDLGLGTSFAMPFVTIESVLPRGGNRLLVANDNNFPFSTGRNPGRADDNEIVVLRVPGLR